MPRSSDEDLLRALEVRLTAFQISQIEAGWRVRLGPLRETVCHFVARGSGALIVSGETTLLAPGTIVIVPAGAEKTIAGRGPILHEVKAEDRGDLPDQGPIKFEVGKSNGDLLIGSACLSATLGLGTGIFDQLRRPLAFNVLSRAGMTAGFGLLLRELSEPGLASSAMADCLMKQVLICLLREQMDDIVAGSPVLQVLTDSRLFPAVSAVLAHPEECHTVSSLAALAGMSRSSFAFRFASRLGQPPMEFVQHIRMRSAARMLRATEMPVKSLASAVGYSSRSQFSRAFKEAYGTDPSTFRSTGTVASAAPVAQMPLAG